MPTISSRRCTSGSIRLPAGRKVTVSPSATRCGICLSTSQKMLRLTADRLSAHARKVTTGRHTGSHNVRQPRQRIPTRDSRRTARAARAEGVDYWVFGGWAVDLYAGRMTRPHADIDIAVWMDDLHRVDGLLVQAGWRHAPKPTRTGTPNTYMLQHISIWRSSLKTAMALSTLRSETVEATGPWAHSVTTSRCSRAFVSTW